MGRISSTQCVPRELSPEDVDRNDTRNVGILENTEHEIHPEVS